MVQILLYVQKAEQKVLYAAIQPNVGPIGKFMHTVPLFDMVFQHNPSAAIIDGGVNVGIVYAEVVRV